MAKRSSSSMDVLLGLLTIEPMSGYDLGLTIRSSVGHFWNESYGQIYPNLKRLKADGLVDSTLERQEGKPDRHMYSITKKGRERLAAWLAVPPQSEVPRNELLLKLFFGAQAAPQLLIGYIEKMAEEEGVFLNKLKQMRKEIAKNSHYPGAPYWAMAARFGEFEMKAHLRWAEETLAELHSIAGKEQSHTETRKEKKHGSK